MNSLRPFFCVFLLGISYGCASHGAAGTGPGASADGLVCDAEVPLTIHADAPPADEAYTCFAFDASLLDGGSYLRGLDWTTETANPVLLHHAGTYASPNPPFAGAIPCDAMPQDSGVLHVWAPGSGALALPADVALVLPPATKSIIIQAHGIRLHDGPPMASTAKLCVVKAAPAHEATWLRAVGPVPTIPPNGRAASTTTCRVDHALHLFSTRPHMHKAGNEFHGSVARAGGAREPIADVVPWVWDDQKSFPLAVDLSAGDAIVTTCAWKNPGDQPVVAGLKSTDEMCHQGLVVWPAADARWAECK